MSDKFENHNAYLMVHSQTKAQQQMRYDQETHCIRRDLHDNLGLYFIFKVKNTEAFFNWIESL